MKKYIIFALLVLVFCCASAQATIENKDYERIYIETGMLVPLDGLKEKINESVNLGFWFHTKLEATESYDIGFNLYVPDSNKTFDYELEDSIFRNRARGVSGMVGVRYCKSFALSDKNKNINIETFPSLGFAFFDYKSDFLHTVRNEAVPEETETKSEVLCTFHIGQGIRLNINNIAVQVQYQYTPYGLFYNYVDKNFGSQSLTFGIVYRQ